MISLRAALNKISLKHKIFNIPFPMVTCNIYSSSLLANQLAGTIIGTNVVTISRYYAEDYHLFSHKYLS